MRLKYNTLPSNATPNKAIIIIKLDRINHFIIKADDYLTTSYFFFPVSKA